MSGLVYLGKNIAIDTAKPLPVFDNGPAKAYAALDNTRARGKNLIAMICHPAYVPRRIAMANYKGLISPTAFLFVASGVCEWPATGDQRFVIVYENSSFDPLAEAGRSKPQDQWRDHDIIESFVKPMASVMNELQSRDVFHGSIRLSNIFYGLPNKKGAVVLGDGLSVPPSCTQGILYEPVERALAHPLARGEGDSADDIYAFGVCVALLVRSVDPMEGLTDDQIIEHKIQHGSYASLVGKDRLSGHVVEILRGCLQDNIDLRWKAQDLYSWADGRRLTPQQSYKNKKAIRPIDFVGNKFFFSRELALAMIKNPLQSQALIESGELLDWLERSVSDMEAVERIRSFLGKDMGKSKTKGNNAILVSSVISALEPTYPLFYKDIGYFPEGIGNYMINLSRSGEDIADIADLLVNGTLTNHVHTQTSKKQHTIILKALESCRLALTQNNVGFGMERCFYILCRDSVCQSEKFSRYFVSTIEEMMAAFEDLAMRHQIKSPIFLDRHSIAYLSVHESSLIDGRLFDLNSKTHHLSILANVKALAALQKRIKNSIYPHICRVLSEGMGELLSRYHDKELRKTVELDLQRVAKIGSISQISEIIDNPAQRNKDKDDFRRAMREYASLRQEYTVLERGMKEPGFFEKRASQSFSAMVSWVLAIIVIVMMVIFKFTAMNS